MILSPDITGPVYIKKTSDDKHFVTIRVHGRKILGTRRWIRLKRQYECVTLVPGR
jgi:hypothetical protein